MNPDQCHEPPEDVVRDVTEDIESGKALLGEDSPTPEELGAVSDTIAEEIRQKAEAAAKKAVADRVPVSLTPSGRVRKNGPCPCGSGVKFKRCCLREVKDPESHKTLPSPSDMRAELHKKGLI